MPRGIDAGRLARRLAGELAIDRDLLHEHARANLDQTQAFAQDFLDELGLTIVEVDVLVPVLATLALVARCAQNGVSNGVTSLEVGLEVELIARILATALQPYLNEVPA